MVFPIAGGTQDTSYEVSNSLMFNDDDNPNLTFTPSSAVTSERKTFTISWWVKRGNLGTTGFMWEMGGNDNANERFICRFDSNNRLNVNDSSTAFRIPNRVFRDPSAWYHIVVAVDTTDSTADNRVKVYINGVQETSFLTSNNPGQDDTKGFSHNSEHTIGRTNIDNGSPFDGYMTEFHAVGGSQLDATSFGEFNDNGVWIPKKYTGSHGTNGFYLEFKQTGTGQNSSGIGADTSGNDNHFAVTNLIDRDVAVDTPTNNFAVLNTAANLQSGSVSQGNTKLVTHGGSSNNSLVPGTIGVQNGKWYVEVYFDSTNYPATGIMPDDTITDVRAGGGSNNSVYLGKSGSKSRFLRYDGQKSSSNSNSTYMAAVNGGDKVVQIALNMDDGEITFGANGSWANGSGSTNQTFGNATAAFTDINSSGDYTGHFSMFIFADENYGTSDTLLTNFGGCPPYAISGTVYSDANGYGKFKYEVPSGYYSVCTKNLAEFG